MSTIINTAAVILWLNNGGIDGQTILSITFDVIGWLGFLWLVLSVVMAVRFMRSIR